jgi:hypothetical protein
MYLNPAVGLRVDYEKCQKQSSQKPKRMRGNGTSIEVHPEGEGSGVPEGFPPAHRVETFGETIKVREEPARRIAACPIPFPTQSKFFPQQNKTLTHALPQTPLDTLL